MSTAGALLGLCVGCATTAAPTPPTPVPDAQQLRIRGAEPEPQWLNRTNELCPQGTTLRRETRYTWIHLTCIDANGKRHGPMVLLWDRKPTTQVSHHSHGLRHGRFAEWRDGQKRVEGHYHRGRRAGTSIYWDENGEVTRLEHWERDLLVDAFERRGGQLIVVVPDCHHEPFALWSTWLRAGGGARLGGGSSPAVRADLGGSIETIIPVTAAGLLRVGPWLQVGTDADERFDVTAGAHLWIDGAFVERRRASAFILRLGGGYSAGRENRPLLAAGLAWGWHAEPQPTIDHRNSSGGCSDDARRVTRIDGQLRKRYNRGFVGHGYLTGGLRTYIALRIGVPAASDQELSWQLTGGLEVTPCALGLCYPVRPGLDPWW